MRDVQHVCRSTCTRGGCPGRSALQVCDVIYSAVAVREVCSGYAAEQRDELARRRSGRDVHFMARPPPRSVRAAFPHTAPASGV